MTAFGSAFLGGCDLSAYLIAGFASALLSDFGFFSGDFEAVRFEVTFSIFLASFFAAFSSRLRIIFGALLLATLALEPLAIGADLGLATYFSAFFFIVVASLIGAGVFVGRNAGSITFELCRLKRGWDITSLNRFCSLLNAGSAATLAP